MLTSENSGRAVEPPATPFGRRWRWAALAALVALQFLGYLLVWLVFHALTAPSKAQACSEVLCSTGWYERGSAYAAWFAKLPVVGAVPEAPAARRFLLAAGFALASGGYFASLLLVRRRALPVSTLRLSLAAVLMAVPLLLLPQMPSTDMWGYVMYGQVGVLHGGNPLIDPPSNYPHDPFLHRMYWKSLPSVYGPAWVAVCALLSRAAQLLGGAPWAYMLSFKGFVVACHLVNVVLVRKILRVIRPGRETLGTLLYGWNPLVLFECAGSAHNDVFMLTLLLAGIAAAAAGRRRRRRGG